MGTTAMSKKRWAWGSAVCGGIGVLTVIALGGALQGCGGGGGGGGGCADGAIQVTWDFAPGTGCVVGDQVVVRVDDNSMTMSFPCSDGIATTPPVQANVTHSVDLTLFDGAGNVVEQSQPISVPVGCGQTVAAGMYEFGQ